MEFGFTEPDLWTTLARYYNKEAAEKGHTCEIILCVKGKKVPQENDEDEALAQESDEVISAKYLLPLLLVIQVLNLYVPGDTIIYKIYASAKYYINAL